jgi:phosphoribosylglycinamide formyltransferase-1
MSNKRKIAVLLSGNGSNLQAIIDYQKTNEAHYEIVAVLSNKEDAYGLKRAESHGILTIVLNHNDFTDRESFDQMMINLLDGLEPELIVLAGFMRILSSEFTEHYQGRLINIHPSLLPKYTGLNTHERAIAAKDKEHGLSIHYVTEELDGGPVFMQATTDIAADDTSDSLKQKIHHLEHLTYPLMIDWISQGRIQLKDNKVFFDGVYLEKPLTFGKTCFD